MFEVRPSKAVSVLMLVVCSLIGIFGLKMIPDGFGFFKLIWGVLAFGMAILHGINVFTRRGVPFVQVRKQPRRRRLK